MPSPQACSPQARPLVSVLAWGLWATLVFAKESRGIQGRPLCIMLHMLSRDFEGLFLSPGICRRQVLPLIREPRTLSEQLPPAERLVSNQIH